MSADQLQYALQCFAQAKDLREAGSGLAYVRQLQLRASAAFDGGEASSIIDTMVNGERFTRRMDVTATELFIITTAVIEELDEDLPGRSVMTYPTFQGGVPL